MKSKTKTNYSIILPTIFNIFLFVSVYTLRSRNTASIFNFSIFFDGKVNLVGALRRSHIPFSVQKRREKQNKNYGKPGNFERNRFSPKSILVFGATLRQMTVGIYVTFSLVVYISIFRLDYTVTK